VPPAAVAEPSLPEPLCPAGIVGTEQPEEEGAPGTSPLDEGLKDLRNAFGGGDA